MSRALVWTVGGFAVLVLGIIAALWIGTAHRSGDSASPAAVVSTPSAPAPNVSTAPAPAALPPAPGAGLVPVAGAGLGAVARSTVAGSSELASSTDAARTEHQQRVQEHRQKVLERIRAHRERIRQHRAEVLQHAQQARALRRPDPNRPPPDRTRVIRGPAILGQAPDGQ